MYFVPQVACKELYLDSKKEVIEVNRLPGENDVSSSQINYCKVKLI